VLSDDYAASFSFEWKRFATTQLDSARRWQESEERLRQSLDFPLEDLKGRLVLDAGCGMGRFAEVVAKYGGSVVAVDLSYAVEVAARNLAPWRDTVGCLQADLRALPLRASTFDLIYSLGVLHHTPDARATFHGLVGLLKPGGKISITLYSGYNKVYVTSTNLWRRLTTRMPKRLVYALSHWAIPAYYLYRVPVLGLLGRALVPISHHPDPEWRLLDTFDCYTPRYQSFHTHYEVFGWMREAGLTDIAVLEPGISFIGTRPAGARAGVS
jgi:SAM-dependent methyltransferase